MVGRGLGAFPDVDFARLANEFTPEEAYTLRLYVEGIFRELDRVDVHPQSESIDGMTKRAIRAVRRAHPELTSEALDALAWKYSFEWYH